MKANTSNKIETDFNTNLTRLLVCPISGGALYYDNNEKCLISRVAKIKFPVRDGVPILLAAESKPIFSD
ncbi:Trm112 family protein [Paracoccaceae bacterium]|nr:Trm112 family protein [Paracoccaceae bacterium]